MPSYKYRCPECGRERRVMTPASSSRTPVICGQPFSDERGPDRVIEGDVTEPGPYLDPRSDDGPPMTQGCGAVMRRGVERVRFYLRADHTPAGGDGRRGWQRPGMSDIDYTSERGESEPRGHHLTYGYDGSG